MAKHIEDEIKREKLNYKQLSQENLKLLYAIEARDTAIAGLEVENRNLKLEIEDLKRNLDNYELFAIGKVGGNSSE